MHFRAFDRVDQTNRGKFEDQPWNVAL